MTMQSNGDNKGPKLELDSTEIGTDDTAFDDAGVDEELDDSMGALPQKKSRSSAKLLAGLVLVGLIGAGGYVGYQQVASGNAAPVAAIPSDVPAGSAMIDPMTGQPMADQPMTADQQAMPPMPMDGNATVDPMMAGTMPADAGMQIDPMTGQPMPAAQPMDSGMPMDANAMPADPLTGMVPPAAPGMPEAVMNDGAMPPADPNAMPVDAMPADPMMGAQPMDGGMPMDANAMPTDPVAGIVPPPADAPVPPAPPVEQMAAPVPAPVPAPAPMPAPVVDTALTQELQSKITTLESRLADMERELNDLRNQQAQAQPAAATKSEVSAADLKALERRIDALATKAASAPPAPPTMVGKAPMPPVAAPMPAPKAAPMPAPAATTNTTNMMPETASIRTAVDGASTSKAPVAAPAAKPVTLTPSAPAAPARATSQWQLRSAQPGRAWIAQQGSQEMRSVGVGDEVPGLGRILSIAQGSDGRWAVRGSMGSVAQ